MTDEAGGSRTIYDAMGGMPAVMALADGPPAYTGGGSPMGDHTGVVRAHSGNGPHDEMDARAVGCFVLAMDEAGLPDDERLRAALTDWFVWATEHVNRDHQTPDAVPADLPMPYWSWDGPQSIGAGLRG
ncbi:hypothetical protein [Promicromonospora iranensis]|uniref:Hemoglobin n=1 Tax=Promicromonospora iranensis TaxID=1105144 RepID=A0ABU2CUT6_9MICO|nr:hypothetical protein [Promicromonospora iranensis]MDR7385094.1 hypothetical protein [Promicromonospora iranensis]